MNFPHVLAQSEVGADETLQTSRDSGLAEQQRLLPGASTLSRRSLPTVEAPGGIADAKPCAPAAGPDSEASALDTLPISEPAPMAAVPAPPFDVGRMVGSRYDRPDTPFAVGGLGEVYQAQDQ